MLMRFLERTRPSTISTVLINTVGDSESRDLPIEKP